MNLAHKSSPPRLDPKRALLLIVDVQEALMPHIAGSERIVERTILLAKAAPLLGWETVCSEQHPRGLKSTVPSLIEALGADFPRHAKTAFGCFADEALRSVLERTGRQQLILCGVEAHVCIVQTALQALAAGWEVFLAEDAIGSRRESDRAPALRRMEQAGCVAASAEMLILESIGDAKSAAFKALLPLIK